VHLDEDGAIEEFVETASVRWRGLEVDTSKLQNIDELRSALEETCAVVRESSAGRPTIVRLALTGRSGVHADLCRPGVLSDLSTDFCQEQLELEPWIWVDRIHDRTRPALDLDEILAEEGLRGDLARLARDLARDPVEAEQAVEEVLAPVEFALAVRPKLDISSEEVVARALDLCLDLLSREGL